MSNVKISQLPSWTGSSADLRWFVMNNAGETETFKFSGYTSPFMVAEGVNNIKNIYDTNVMTGQYSAIISGINGQANGIYSIVVGGINNITNAYASFVGGYGNTNNGEGGFLFGGSSQITGGSYGANLGGVLNNLNGNRSSILGGLLNSVSSNFSQILNGQENSTINSSLYTSILNGVSNTLNNSNYSQILNGVSNNLVSNDYSAIIGGTGNTMATSVSAANGKRNYIINSSDCAVEKDGQYQSNNVNYIGCDNVRTENLNDVTFINVKNLSAENGGVESGTTIMRNTYTLGASLFAADTYTSTGATNNIVINPKQQDYIEINTDGSSTYNISFTFVDSAIYANIHLYIYYVAGSTVNFVNGANTQWRFTNGVAPVFSGTNRNIIVMSTWANDDVWEVSRSMYM
jgi:hypothetical protein